MVCIAFGERLRCEPDREIWLARREGPVLLRLLLRLRNDRFVLLWLFNVIGKRLGRNE